jgi:hypothetical protein
MTVYSGGKTVITVSGNEIARGTSGSIEISRSLNRYEYMGSDTDEILQGNKKVNGDVTCAWIDDYLSVVLDRDCLQTFDVEMDIKDCGGTTQKSIKATNCKGGEWSLDVSAGAEAVENELSFECEDYEFNPS